MSADVNPADGRAMLQKLSDEYKKLRAQCRRYCGTWNSEDRDCEIYGDYHPSPAHCGYFLRHELEARRKSNA